jgi:L-asparaginase
MQKKTAILIVYTGGTIGMVEDASTGMLKPFDFKFLAQQIPEIKRFDLEIVSFSFEKPIDSSDMSPEVWVKMASVIEENYEKFDGFVVLHGSDTMAYSASALSFMLEHLTKPVIFTGSQLPIGRIRTDGKENIITAIEIAAAKINGKPVVPEVAVYFEFKLYRGNRTHKFNAEHFQAFQSPNYPLLAEAGVNIIYNHSAIMNTDSTKALKVHKALSNDIAIIKLFPGISNKVIASTLSIRNLRAVIIETYGSGNASVNSEFYELLDKAIKSGIVVLNITQCKSGRVEQGKYETSSAFNRLGVVGGADMTIEAAVAKLMYLLGKDLHSDQVKESLKSSLRGETSV